MNRAIFDGSDCRQDNIVFVCNGDKDLSIVFPGGKYHQNDSWTQCGYGFSCLRCFGVLISLGTSFCFPIVIDRRGQTQEQGQYEMPGH